MLKNAQNLSKYMLCSCPNSHKLQIVLSVKCNWSIPKSMIAVISNVNIRGRADGSSGRYRSNQNVNTNSRSSNEGFRIRMKCSPKRTDSNIRRGGGSISRGNVIRVADKGIFGSKESVLTTLNSLNKLYCHRLINFKMIQLRPNTKGKNASDTI